MRISLLCADATGWSCNAAVKADDSLLHMELLVLLQVTRHLGRCRVDTLSHLWSAPAAS